MLLSEALVEDLCMLVYACLHICVWPASEYFLSFLCLDVYCLLFLSFLFHSSSSCRFFIESE